MSRRLAATALTTGLVAGLLSVAPGDADAAVRRPDLVVAALTAGAEVAAGATLPVSLKTKNRGRSRAGASTTKVYLSRDRRVGRDVAVASVLVPRLRPGRARTARIDLRVPAGTAPRSYRLIACADARRRVRESRERNNCRLLKRSVTVTAAGDDLPDFPLAPDPITVAPEVDGARAVSRTALPTEDTTITATGADGTTYTLDLPAGALIGLETITLTPVAAIGDLPLSGGLEAAVQLEPHGLVLLEQATLTIDSPGLGPIAQQTPFYFHEGGEDFHLYPVLPPRRGDDAGTVRLPIDHFSTPGVGRGTDADRAGVLDRPPARAQAQIAGEIADLVREAREADPNGDGPGDPTLGAKIEARMNAYYDGVIKPQLAAAEKSPRNRALVKKAIEDALSWMRNLQLLLARGDDPYSSSRTEDALQRVERVLQKVYVDRWERCSQDHELEVLPELLTISRQASLLGYAWADAPHQRFLDCSRFEVRFDSSVAFDGTWPLAGEDLHDVPHTGSGRWRAEATTTNAFRGDGGIAQASLPLTDARYHSEYSFRRSDGSTCNGSTDQIGSTPGILRTTVLPSFEANPREVPPDGDWTPPPVDIVISVIPTGVIDHRRVVDCAGGDYTTEVSSEWLFIFRDFHPADLQLLRSKKADRSGDLVYGETWDSSRTEPNHLGSENWTETTSLEVWHKPEV